MHPQQPTHVLASSTSRKALVANTACVAVCLFLQDADLLLLSLLCHEPYFIVMRENMEAGVSVCLKVAWCCFAHLLLILAYTKILQATTGSGNQYVGMLYI